MSESFVFRISRQDAPDRPDTQRIEEHSLSLEPNTTLMGALFRLSEDVPLAFDAACHSDRCGACTLLVNGRVRPACRTRVGEVSQKGRVLLQPLGRFPLIRDLSVDRSAVRESFRALGTGLDPEGDARLGKKSKRRVLVFDRCSECAACLEACPEWDPSGFAGAAALNELLLLELLPSARAAHGARVDALMGPRGIHGCGKNENCVEVCPERIPLVDAILTLQRTATKSLFRR